MPFPRSATFRIRSKLTALVVCFLAGFGLFGLFAVSSFNTVKVNGPIYARIVQSKDVIADILPPPEYVIESNLNALQMIAEVEAGSDHARLSALADRAKELRKEYENRHAFWRESLPQDELKQALVESSYEPAIKFYQARDGEFIRAILAGDVDRARAVYSTLLQPNYEAHRAAIDRVVLIATRRARQDEDEAARSIALSFKLLLVIGIVTATVSASLSALLGRSIVLPLARIAGVARGVADGRLDAAPLAGITSRDEIGVLAGTFTVMTTKLKETLEGLEAKNAELERFAYVVSHDLKSPLITIKGFLGYLKRDALAGETDRLEADASRIASAVDKMEQLLDDLLQASRIGRVIDRPEDVAFGDLARDAASLVAGRVTERGVELEVVTDLPVVHGDRARLVEMLQNLVENAVKFMGDQPHPRVEIGARLDDAETVLYVRDNGKGIEPRYAQRVFGLVERLDPKTAGSGVGLTIVKRIVEAHGGRIWVESEGLGRGSTFCFILPGTGSSTGAGKVKA